jgi:hypothetical protein
MKQFVQGCLGICWLLASANAQVNPAGIAAVRSLSGQFIVYGSQQSSTIPIPGRLSANTNLVRLEPTLLAVSCERIKQALLGELGAPDQWRGRIHLVLHPVQNPDETIVVTSSKFADGWSYHMELPDAIEPPRFVRAMIRLLLLELTNRNAPARSTEVPLWLSEGLSQQVLATSDIDLLVSTPAPVVAGLPQGHTTREMRKFNPLIRTQEQLHLGSLLTVEELSWTTEELLLGDTAVIFRNSAQLFLSELLRLKDGRACLRVMLGALPQCLNWQTAFFQAFRLHFQQPLDLEKWWALHVVHFTGRNPAPAQSDDESGRKLDELVRIPVQVRGSTNDPPQRAEATLQTIVQEWDYASQRQALQGKVWQLQMLSPRVAQPLQGLADEYRQTLEAYLRKVGKTGLSLTARPPNPAVRRVIEQTVNQLNVLDARREALRSSQTGPAPPPPGDAGIP